MQYRNHSTVGGAIWLPGLHIKFWESYCANFWDHRILHQGKRPLVFHINFNLIICMHPFWGILRFLRRVLFSRTVHTFHWDDQILCHSGITTWSVTKKWFSNYDTIICCVWSVNVRTYNTHMRYKGYKILGNLPNTRFVKWLPVKSKISVQLWIKIDANVQRFMETSNEVLLVKLIL